MAVIDEMTGMADVYVDRIRPVVELYRESEIPAGYVCLPLIEVTHNVQSAKIEPTSNHPPMLRMGASAYLSGSTGLLRALQNLRDTMWDKMNKLTGMASSDGPERVAAMSPEERAQLGLARNIAASLPLLDAIILDPEVAPVQAYRTLAHVVSSMAWVGSNPAPLAMQSYTHENCAPQFFSAIEYVSRKLALINTDWDSLAFSRVSELIFARRLPEDARTSILVEVRLREGQSQRDMQEWLADARIGSEELMPLLRQRRLSGALWRVLNGAEVAALGLRSDAIVVRIDNQQVEIPQQGMIDCFQPGRSLLIHGNSPQFMPSAVILQHRLSGDLDATNAGRAGTKYGDVMGDNGGDLDDLAEGMEAIHA
jgi:type VI secretion system protein ImpJ